MPPLADRSRLVLVSGSHRRPQSLPPPDPGPRLPAPPKVLTSFVGRERELALVAEVLGDPQVRLVTLTGPGGVGKTRLAIAAAECMPAGTPVGFVALVAVPSSERVLPTIAHALGIPERAASSPLESLIVSLADRSAVLLLDNLEHVIGCGPDLVELLRACPNLRLLVTSRSPLRVSGEHRIPTPPLHLPDPGAVEAGGDRGIDRLAEIDAVRLFVERGRAAAPGFALTAANAVAVAAICDRLGGLPLAIELAAARVAELEPTDLLARMSRQLPVLTGGPRDQPARLRSMRDAVAWSLDSLDAPARRLFRRLAVLPGGAPLDAVDRFALPAEPEAAGAQTQPGATTPEPVDLLRHLVDAGLLLRVDRDGEEARFAMLEPVREVAEEDLAASGEVEAAMGCLVDWLLGRARTSDWWRSFAVGPDETGWFGRWEREIDNVRAALAWAEANNLPNPLLRLAAALYLFWWSGGRVGEGRGWIERGLSLPAPVAARQRAVAVTVASALAHRQDDNGRAAELALAAAEAWRSAGEPAGVGYADYLRAIARYRQGDAAEAERLYASSVRALRLAGHRAIAAEALFGLAQIDRDAGRFERAAARFREALAVQEDECIAWGAALSRYGIATVLQSTGDVPRALDHYRESLRYWRAIGDWASVAVCLEGIASACCAAGDPRPAARLFGAAHALREAAGAPIPCRALPSYGAAFADVRGKLGAAAFADAWREGWRLPMDRAIEAARGVQLTAAPPRLARAASGPHGLSGREREVLRLVAAGLTDREIADVLSIGKRTASDHVGHILRKLDARSRADAAAFAVRHGLA